MENESDNHYYRVHYKSNTISSWEVCHTLEDVHKFLLARAGKLSGVIITIEQEYGWDEQERHELARLKEKYEPNNG